MVCCFLERLDVGEVECIFCTSFLWFPMSVIASIGVFYSQLQLLGFGWVYSTAFSVWGFIQRNKGDAKQQLEGKKGNLYGKIDREIVV
jgi:hypothetical protein